ncbi:MAG: hypothetical protein HYX87_08740 [Chloroflexi bacterium]|nr:hypothetical protein [Chloroflexota bacterium]
MRFLVISKGTSPIPIEMVSGAMDATLAWNNRYIMAKKFEQVWGFAGIPAGGGVINVESADELDQIMSEFPLAPFSHTEIYPLVDAKNAFERAKKAAAQEMAMAPKR